MGYSPMMKQYLKMKEVAGEALLFFRLGDFYEMFFEDAKVASRELELTLTGRDCGLSDRAPMCGVPFSSVDTYIARLISLGYKVAICEQITEPDGKGIVQREIARVVTPGTVMEDTILDRAKNNYLLCAYCGDETDGSGKTCDEAMAAAWTDISTGELSYSVLDSAVKLNELLSRLNPAEIICNEKMLVKSVDLSTVKFGAVCKFSLFDETAFDYKNAISVLSNQFGADFAARLAAVGCVNAAGALIKYLTDTQKRRLDHLRGACLAEPDCMEIDSTARRTLELFENTTDNKKRGSLLWVLDKTKTGMGARTLRKWLESPLKSDAEINLRLDGVEELICDNQNRREGLISALKDMRDIERLCGKLSYGNISPKDCLALGWSLTLLPQIKLLLDACSSMILSDINTEIGDHTKTGELILSAINPEPAPNVREGGVIKKGFDAVLDGLLEAKSSAGQILAEIEKREKELTGIKNLKIGYNKVFGFFIEVTKSQVSLVPYRYARKQTLTNAERYITEEIKEIEDRVLHAEEKAIAREIELYNRLLAEIKKHVSVIMETAKGIAALDCLISFATVSRENNYIKPVVSADSDRINISEGRHPVVELLLKNEDFTPNNTLLDCGDNKIILITGPNMAGKSIYMRQVALITIMAHIGCFVPAKSAEIGITDRIFTRVGASDDVTTGRSTFMVEMNESRDILLHSTPNSLILLDEVGRGTATYDGMSIAYGIIKYIATKIGAKTLFATHYHELTELEGVLPGVKNYHVGVREFNGDIVFLRKVLKGAAGKSYGIEVAKLAGLPEEVIDDAKRILKHLESQSLGVSVVEEKKDLEANKEDVRFENPVITKLKTIDPDLMSPMEALSFLANLKKEAYKI